MNGAWLELLALLAILWGVARPLGVFIARVLEGKPTWPQRLLGPLERLLYRAAFVDPSREMTWRSYAVAMLVFNLLGLVALFLIQRLQGLLPLNPGGLGPVGASVAFNAAVSFATNTNWQAYGGETTMSLLTQMLGLTTQNFLSAATGIAIMAALARGLARVESPTVGNFWVDLTRSVLYVLLPLSLVLALALAWQGVPQTLQAARQQALGGGAVRSVALGPVASQVAIKQLGTNGGGFFNANSAHPLENPTPASNFLQLVAILLIPAALCLTFGEMVGDRRQGWALLAAMTLVFGLAAGACIAFESAGNPLDVRAGLSAVGGNMEGKEVRFGAGSCALWAVATTAASNGSVNSALDSYTPLGGLVPLLMMHLGEVIFGGVGSGLYGMLMFVLVAVFVAGLMVGRTPEYLGKKVEAYEIKMAALVLLLMPALALGMTAWGTCSAAGRAAALNAGPHGFSEILYAFTSMGNNNGSAFAGLNPTNWLYALGGAVAMFLSRYWIAIPVLAVAGSMASRKRVPAGAGTLPTHSPLFVAWLLLVVAITGALAFVPALALGPIVEHLLMQQGMLF